VLIYLFCFISFYVSVQTFPVNICVRQLPVLVCKSVHFRQYCTACLTNWQLLFNVLTVVCEVLAFALVCYFVPSIILFLNMQNLLPVQRDAKVVCIFEFSRK